MFFLLYYMLMNGAQLERVLSRVTPLQKDSLNALAKETRSMVRANAIGIPVISIIQGFTAAIGYWIFGVKEPVLWGFLTGIFAFFPLVGTMLVWVPLVLLLVSQGNSGMAIGLGLYSLLVTGNVDYVARMGLMKKMGDVHPLVTVFGVIVGLKLFGFIGLIFGPLLISYFVILIKIYSQEFSASKADKAMALESEKVEEDSADNAQQSSNTVPANDESTSFLKKIVRIFRPNNP